MVNGKLLCDIGTGFIEVELQVVDDKDGAPIAARF